MRTSGVNLNLYKTDVLSSSRYINEYGNFDGAEEKSELSEGQKQTVEVVYEVGRPLRTSEAVHKFFDTGSGLDSFFKMFKQFGELMQDLQPSEALWGRVSERFGEARNATAPLYLVLCLNKAYDAIGQGALKVTKAWSDLVSAICINWLAFSKLVDVKAHSLVGRALTCSSFVADVTETAQSGKEWWDLGNQEHAYPYAKQRVTEERRVVLAKTIAVAGTAFVGGCTISAFALGSSPISLTTGLGIALGSTVLKNGANLYQHFRKNDLPKNPVAV